MSVLLHSHSICNIFFKWLYFIILVGRTWIDIHRVLWIAEPCHCGAFKSIGYTSFTTAVPAPYLVSGTGKSADGKVCRSLPNVYGTRWQCSTPCHLAPTLCWSLHDAVYRLTLISWCKFISLVHPYGPTTVFCAHNCFILSDYIVPLIHTGPCKQYLTYFHTRDLKRAAEVTGAHVLHKSRFVHNCN